MRAHARTGKIDRDSGEPRPSRRHDHPPRCWDAAQRLIQDLRDEASDLARRIDQLLDELRDL